MMTAFDLLKKLKTLDIKLGLDEQNNLIIRGDKNNLNPDLIASIKSLKPELVSLLLQDQGAIAKSIIPNVDRNNVFRLSFAQQRLWILDHIEGSSTQYNLPNALSFSGVLDYDVMYRAFNTILERHESLRTCFDIDEDGQPYQIIKTTKDLGVVLEDFSTLDENTRQIKIAQTIAEEASRPFDLRVDLMMRAKLLKISATEHIVLVTMHHIASDGWSMSVVKNEFTALYNAYIQGKENPLSPLDIQYADYAHWQRNWLQGEVLDKQLGYWEKQLASLPVTHNLPLDRPRPRLQSFTGKTHHIYIPAITTKALEALCKTQGATLFMGLHATVASLLARYSNERDIVVGSPVANREQEQVKGLIGCFVNTLVLRSDLSTNPSFLELIQQSKTMLLDAYAHQQVPLEQIVERLQPERSLSHSALFQVLLILQNNREGHLQLPNLTLGTIEQNDNAIAKYDLTINVFELVDGLKVEWEYNTDLFDASTIERMANHFESLLTLLIKNPDENVFKFSMLDEDEKNKLLVKWNNTSIKYPDNKFVHELFETQVANHPHAIAAVFENQPLTYEELNTKANQLAHYLMNEKQVTPDALVGICVERSLDMLVAILGVLKAGGAYVPLDPDYPEARLAYMLADANLTTVITHSRLLARLPISKEQALCIDDGNVQQQFMLQSTQNINTQQLGLTSSNLAYVIYTSGSTGNPKGVEAPHASIFNRINWMEQHFPSLVDDVFCQKTAAGFVDHVAEIFQSLAYGKKLIVVSTEDILAPGKFPEIVNKYQITRLTLVPSLLKHFIQQDVLASMASLRLVISSGEALQLEETRNFYRALPNAQLLNLYGSSEIGADVSAYLIDMFDDNPDVMQYFLDPVSSSSQQQATPAFKYKLPLSLVDNSEFREQYSQSSLPQHPKEYQDYVGELSETVLPYVVDVAAQRYIGHMTSKLPNFIPELSRLIAQLNQNMVKVETSNSLTLIERQVLAMMHRLFYQLPAEFYDQHCQDPSYVFGVMTGGGSVANLTALWYGRNRGLLKQGVSQSEILKQGAHALIYQKGFKRAVILGTRLMHYSMRKSAGLMGIGEDGIVYVAQDAQQKMSMDDLKRCIEKCQQDNIFIIAIVGIAGATETGTVDPLTEIAAIAHQHNIHFHADAAWGGAFQLSQTYRHRLAGIEQADSITFCPHKQLYLSQGISLCMLRDPQSADSIATHASYQSQKGSYDLGQYTVEGSRPAHALLLHASLHLLGQNGYAWLLEQGMRKTRYFTHLVEKSSCFELVGYPDLNIINYRYIPIELRSKTYYSTDDNKYISESIIKIQQEQFASSTSFVSKTTIQPSGIDVPITVFRIVLSNPLTRFDDLRDVLEDQLRIANTLIEKPEDHHRNILLAAPLDVANIYADWRVPIGKPISNTQLMVLDANLNLVPQGVFGELHVGGLGLARGYHNLPTLTDEKFIPNPFYDKNNVSSSERLYKTGDLVRWLPDGNLEYLGRIDHQVKIRGFRIELGEIENVIVTHDKARDAVVIAKDSPIGDKQLIAYVATDDLSIIESLRQHLAAQLPDYMIPAAFVLLEKLPLTPNGKIDRKSLPEPDLLNQQQEYIAPRTEPEIIIAKIWSEMFGLDVNKIGANSNFFHLGGESLSAIKFISRAEKNNIFISAKEVMGLQTLAKLAAVASLSVSATATKNTVHHDPLLVDTPCLLLPEQEWFFSEHYENPQHFNTSAIIEMQMDLDPGLIQKSIVHLMSVHEVLQSRYCEINGVITAFISGLNDQAPFVYSDLSLLPESEQYQQISQLCKQYQTRFDIENGPLFTVIYFNRGKDRTPLLFFAVNHLLMDAASMEIFHEDFLQTYSSFSSGNVSSLPSKKYSYIDIANAIDRIVNKPEFGNRIRFWQEQPWNKYQHYRTDYPCTKALNIVSSARDVSASLGKADTDILLRAVGECEIPLIDVIYYSLSKALLNINDGNILPIWHVASGRNFISLNSDIDMSNVVGWFSMPSPRFVCINNKSIYDDLMSVHENLKNVPDSGCSYLPLLYSNSKRDQKIPFFPDEDKVVLNHLGYVSGSFSPVSNFDTGLGENPTNYRSCLFKCVTKIQSGELIVSWGYSSNQYNQNTIEKLVSEFLSAIRSASKACTEQIAYCE